jgi:hypothetical protein
MDRGASVLLTVAGEWLFELSDDAGVLGRFSVWVGREPPAWNPFSLPAEAVDWPEALERRTYALLAEVRRYYDKRGWTTDPLLGNLLDGVAPGADTDAALRGVGIPPEKASTFSCRASTVEDCLDGWAWSIPARRIVLADERASVGVAIHLDTEGVQLNGVVVGE